MGRGRHRNRPFAQNAHTECSEGSSMGATETQAPVEHTVRVVPWTWRDGSVHLEVWLTSFHNENNEIECHLQGDEQRFTTACGVGWWGVGSASGIGHTQKVTCESCREILRTAALVVDPEGDPA